MGLLESFLKEQISELINRKIRLRVVGRYRELPERIQALLHKAEETTQDYDEFTLGLALNYGSRTEVVDAVKAVAQAAIEGRVDLNDLDYDSFRQYLYTRDMPDPDLVIRTSGEYRLSNFLLLQSAYSEIYFSKVHWPDFDETEFKAAIAEFASRERRYGKTTEQIKA
jgi:undecaprenyl diphosphate synthase